MRSPGHGRGWEGEEEKLATLRRIFPGYPEEVYPEIAATVDRLAAGIALQPEAERAELWRLAGWMIETDILMLYGDPGAPQSIGILSHPPGATA